MRKQKKKFIINLSGLIALVLVVTGMAYLTLYNDPILVEIIQTGDPNTTLIKEIHTKSGKVDYYFEIIDGMGNIQRESP